MWLAYVDCVEHLILLLYNDVAAVAALVPCPSPHSLLHLCPPPLPHLSSRMSTSFQRSWTRVSPSPQPKTVRSLQCCQRGTMRESTPPISRWVCPSPLVRLLPQQHRLFTRFSQKGSPQCYLMDTPPVPLTFKWDTTLLACHIPILEDRFSSLPAATSTSNRMSSNTP